MKRGESGINALLGIDKPCGMTSHDVVDHVRRALGERRVGHAGTLDPSASGVMLVGVGQGTRLMGLLTAERKTYRALVAFGCETDTDDGDGVPTRAAAVPPSLSNEQVARDMLASLVGEQDQVPPAYSAISVDGKRSYALARAGEAPELAPRHITIFSADLVELRVAAGSLVWVCDFTVSKGTYIRAIARDLGMAAGSAAHLAGLVRLSSGSLTLDECVSLDVIDRATSPEAILARALDPARTLGLPVRSLTSEELADALCGKTIAAGEVRVEDGSVRPSRPGERVSLVFDEKLYGVWDERDGRLHAKANFPEGILGVRL